jgi:hypothetical protein
MNVNHGTQRPRPYLSLVVTARNDDHGGNLLRRMQIFINTFHEQCERHGLPSELVLVEWNPPPDRPLLQEALTWPTKGTNLSIRILQVPEAIHTRFAYSDKLPLFQMIAKNVGIRRAAADFVLATNIDIVFSDELIQFLAMRTLVEGRMYRIDRYDIPESVPYPRPTPELLEYCKEHVVRIHRRTETEVIETKESHEISSAPPSTPRVARLIPRFVKVTPPYKWIQRRYVNRHHLHTNACGDFTLLSRSLWETVRGYPELEMYSIHLDSVLCHAAYQAGAREVILEDPLRAYHIDHSSGWSLDASKGIYSDSRLDPHAVPQLTGTELEELARRMRETRKHIVFNGEDWGLATEDLREIRVPFLDRESISSP